MAGRGGSIAQAAIATGTAAKTILQLVPPASQDIVLTGVAIAFKGVSNTGTPILVQLIRQSTAGTTSALTPRPLDDGWSGTLQTTARHTATAEPTGTVIIKQWSVHPQTGLDWQPFERGQYMIVGGQRLGLVVTAAADVNCDPTMEFEE